MVFHIGDLALGKKENLEGLAPLLNGRLYLLRGNHDRRGKAFYHQLGITLVPDPYPVNHPSGLCLVFSHCWLCLEKTGCFHPTFLRLKVDVEQMFCYDCHHLAARMN
jgi:hypothetical protein